MTSSSQEPVSGPLFTAKLRVALAQPVADEEALLAVVVVNYRSHRLLAVNLPDGLAAAANARIIVVDNYSDWPERRALRDLAAERSWDLVEPGTNLGFGEGVNAGVLRGAELGSRTFLTLNPDAIAPPEVLAGIGQAVRERPSAVLSPIVTRPDGRPFFRGSTINMRTGQIRTGWVEGDADPEWKNWLSGACLAFSGEAFAELGGFADGYFLYWEDVDLSRRAANLGLELALLPDLQVVHDEGGTHTARGTRAKSSLYYYYNVRNRLLFGARLADRADRARWLTATPRESLRIWLRGGRRQLLTQPLGALATVRGAFAGVQLFLRHANTDTPARPAPTPGGPKADV